MIRENAKIDEAYVKSFCEKLNIPVFIKHVDVLSIAKEQKLGTEETGRNERYKFFEEVLLETGSNKIAIAHNSNDKAETVIMNILRGSGISGLKGIEPKRDNKYIRPLIETSRDEIENYCRQNKLETRHDESNDENIYNRNKIRNIVIPYIKKEFNNNIVNTINRLSTVATEESEFINKIVESEYNNICTNKEENSIELDLKKFNELDIVIKRRIILYTINNLQNHTKGIEKTNIEDIIKLCSNNIGNKFLVPTKGLEVLIKNKKILFIKSCK